MRKGIKRAMPDQERTERQGMVSREELAAALKELIEAQKETDRLLKEQSREADRRQEGRRKPTRRQGS